MVIQFPLAKIIFVAAKQASKPISRAIKNYAKYNPIFRKYVCIPPGRAMNWIEIRAKLYMLNLKQPKRVPPLTEAMACNVGAEILGEIVLLFLGISIVFGEVWRTNVNNQKKHDGHVQKDKHLSEQISLLDAKLSRQEGEIECLKEKLNCVSNKDRNSNQISKSAA